MYSKIAVALNELTESQHALRAAIDLAHLCYPERSSRILFVLGRC